MPDHQDLQLIDENVKKEDEAEVCDEDDGKRVDDLHDALYGIVHCHDYGIANTICYRFCRITAIRKPQGVWKIYEKGFASLVPVVGAWQ